MDLIDREKVRMALGIKSGGRLMDERGLTVEAYTLVLKHSIWDEGEEHELEEPIAVRCLVDVTFGNSTIMINEMMDKMKHELLLRCAR